MVLSSRQPRLTTVEITVGQVVCHGAAVALRSEYTGREVVRRMHSSGTREVAAR